MRRRLSHSRSRVPAPSLRQSTAERYAGASGRTDRNRKKSDVLGAIRLLVLLLLLAQSLRVAFTSPRLRIQEVRISGTSRLTSDQVRELGEVRMGQNIFGVNLSRVSRRVRSQPFIRHAVVTRELPDSLVVHLEERVPAYQVIGKDGLFEADDEGIVFQRAASARPGMPTLDLGEQGVPALGKPIAEDWMRVIRECLALAEKEKLDIRTLRVDPARELWLSIASRAAGAADGRSLSVRLGRATELPEKFRDIRKVLDGWPELTVTAQYLNVMCAGRPAYLQLPDDPDGSGETASN